MPPKRTRKQTAKESAAAKKRKVAKQDVEEEETEGQHQEEEEEEPELYDAFTVSESDNATTITFKRNAATLRNCVQAICTNYGTNGRPLQKASLEDLFFARFTLQTLLLADDEEEDEENESAQIGLNKEKSDEERLKAVIRTKAKQHLQAFSQGNVPAGLDELMSFINKESKDKMAESKRLLSKGLVNFESLGELFKPGMLVTGKSVDTGAAPVGYRVLHASYHSQQGVDVKFRWFSLQMEVVVSTGKKFLIVQYTDLIREFVGNVPVTALDYQPMTEDVKAQLVERGKRYVKLAIGSHYMKYASDGFSIHTRVRNIQQQATVHSLESITVSTFLRGSGRVMLDMDVGRRLGHYPVEASLPGNTIMSAILTYHQQQQQQQQQQNMHYRGYGYNHHNTTQEMETVPTSMLPLCWPAITGFSFTAKVWGHVVIDSLEEIKFDDNAFQQLVLDESRKNLIKAMVVHSDQIFKDIISGKGGGCVFLLHGPPGVGKTLTAEAVAEMLHKPMYVVSMGELGTTPTELETKLNQVLELASVWDALVLLDEADIFLERRGQKEVLRNAMVGVMMRQIEYFQGVLFLTSNRVDVFDEAFHSRVTVALKYSKLSQDIRESVWKMLLEHSGVKGVDSAKLSAYELNGRQIKNCICLAQGLARADGSDVTAKHLQHTIDVCMEFQQHVTGEETKTKTIE